METMEFIQSKSVIYTRLSSSDAIGKMSRCGKSQIIRKWEWCHSNEAIDGLGGIFSTWIFYEVM